MTVWFVEVCQSIACYTFVIADFLYTNDWLKASFFAFRNYACEAAVAILVCIFGLCLLDLNIAGAFCLEVPVRLPDALDKLGYAENL